jgi:hypothetical protein
MVKTLLSLKCEVNIANVNGDTSYTLMRRDPEYIRIIQVLMQNEFDLGIFTTRTQDLPPQVVVNLVGENRGESPVSNDQDNSSRDIGGEASQMIQESLAPIASLMSSQEKEIKNLEDSISSVERDFDQAMKKEAGENESLNGERRLYTKLMSIVTRLETAISNVGGKRKREDVEQEGGKFREFVENLIPPDVNFDVVAEKCDTEVY